MAHDSDHKTSAELQREIDQQRNRLEDRIDQIQEKLSPGQLVDELLTYTKGGGGEIVSNLQRQMTANPLPIALLGVSLAWLIAKPAGPGSDTRSDASWDRSINRSRGYVGGAGDDFDDDYVDDYAYEDDEIDYPLATVSGSSMRRLGDLSDEKGNRFTEFADDTGRKFKAATDAMGRRAGHFRDDAGNTYRGFTDATGGQIQHFRDEAGNLLEEASGWASQTWRKARERLHDAQHAIGSGSGAARRHAVNAGGALRGRAVHAGGAIQGGAGQLGDTLVHQFRDQPLVAGALAFALGAALGSALPTTEQEDAVLGDASDKLKAQAGAQATQLYEQGREKATEVYEQASSKVGDVYQQAKDGLTSAAGGSSETSSS